MGELKLSEQFRLHFQQLRNSCNDSPQSLITFFREKPEIEANAKQLKRVVDIIEQVSTFRKIHPQMSSEFIEDWQSYMSHWKTQVEYVNEWPMLSLNIFGDPSFKPTTFEHYTLNQSEVLVREVPDPVLDENFDAVCHDGGAAIRQMVALVSEKAEYQRVHPRNDHDYFAANTVLVGVEAIEYLENSIGIEIARVFDRWNRMPTVFVPKHVSDQHGLTDDRSLFGLFNQAVRAYVAGAPAAAIALCRSLLEMVLKNHYLSPKSGNDRRRINDMKLNKVIDLAVERYSFLDKDQLDGHRKFANRVLHGQSNADRLSAEDEIDLLKFFRDLKNYIERAPHAPRPSN